MVDGEATPQNTEPSLKFTFDDYETHLLDPDFTGLTNEEQGKIMGVTKRTIIEWNKKVDWDDIRDKRRELFARQTVKVDDAMLRKAQAGDTRAAEIYYQRFDKWIPETKSVLNLERKSDDELAALAAKLKADLLANEKKDRGADDRPGDEGAGAENPA